MLQHSDPLWKIVTLKMKDRALQLPSKMQGSDHFLIFNLMVTRMPWCSSYLLLFDCCCSFTTRTTWRRNAWFIFLYFYKHCSILKLIFLHTLIKCFMIRWGLPIIIVSYLLYFALKRLAFPETLILDLRKYFYTSFTALLCSIHSLSAICSKNIDTFLP